MDCCPRGDCRSPLLEPIPWLARDGFLGRSGFAFARGRLGQAAVARRSAPGRHRAYGIAGGRSFGPPDTIVARGGEGVRRFALEVLTAAAGPGMRCARRSGADLKLDRGRAGRRRRRWRLWCRITRRRAASSRRSRTGQHHRRAAQARLPRRCVASDRAGDCYHAPQRATLDLYPERHAPVADSFTIVRPQRACPWSSKRAVVRSRSSCSHRARRSSPGLEPHPLEGLTLHLDGRRPAADVLTYVIGRVVAAEDERFSRTTASTCRRWQARVQVNWVAGQVKRAAAIRSPADRRVPLSRRERTFAPPKLREILMALAARRALLTSARPSATWRQVYPDSDRLVGIFRPQPRRRQVHFGSWSAR